MKYLGLSLIFLGWCILTFVSICTIFGLIILIDNTDWFEFPVKILEKF